MSTSTSFAFPDKETCEVAWGKGKCVKAPDGTWHLNALDVSEEPSPKSPGIDWDPLSWGKSALSDLTGGVGSIEKWVIKQIVKAASLLENDIRKVYGYLASRFGGIENTISHLAGQVNSVIGGIPHDITSTLADLRHDVAADVDAAVKQASRGLGDVGAGLESVVHDAEKYTDSAVAEVKRDVIDPLEKDLRRAIHDAESAADHAWHVWYSDIWAPAEHELAEARHDAAKAITFIDHSALDAIHLIDECWDWLLWVAKNPAKAIEELPSKLLPSLTTASLESQGATVQSGFDGLVTELDKVYPDD